MTVPLTTSCLLLGCTDDLLACHRCGTREGVTERLIVPGLFSLAGAQPKLSVRYTHSCDACVERWYQILFD